MNLRFHFRLVSQNTLRRLLMRVRDESGRLVQKKTCWNRYENCRCQTKNAVVNRNHRLQNSSHVNHHQNALLKNGHIL